MDDGTQTASDVERQIEDDRLRRLGELAGGIIHDLRNLLSPVVTYTEAVLRDKRLHPALREPLSLARTGARDIADLAQRLRVLISPADRSTMRAVDLESLLQQIPALTRPKWCTDALRRRVTIAFNLELEPVRPVLAIASDLRHVLVNLVFNAVDAMRSNGTITLRLRNRPPEVIVEVEDTGVGMNNDLQLRCFQKGFTTKTAGTGLGLAICADLIRQHGGELKVNSEIGKGTIFCMSFPAAGSHGAPLEVTC